MSSFLCDWIASHVVTGDGHHCVCAGLACRKCARKVAPEACCGHEILESRDPSGHTVTHNTSLSPRYFYSCMRLAKCYGEEDALTRRRIEGEGHSKISQFDSGKNRCSYSLDHLEDLTCVTSSSHAVKAAADRIRLIGASCIVQQCHCQCL